jgi:cytoskeleton protein RodZ
MSNFGTSFKSTRESMGLTIEQIAVETRIAARFLEAIENEDFQLLPGGIFSRGFVRTYAERLGMDPERAVGEFEQYSSYREPAVLDVLRASTPPSGNTSRALYPVAIGALVILVFAFYFLTKRPSTLVTATPPVAAPTQPEPAPAVPDQPAAAAEAGASDQTEAAKAALPPETVPTPAATEQVTPASPPATQKTDAMTVVLEATEQSWVKVVGDSDTVLASEILEPGMTRRFTAQTSINLTIGNASGIKVTINDHQLAPLGKTGQVRSITITPDNLKRFIGG